MLSAIQPFYPSYKMHWSDSRKDVLLSVSGMGIVQCDKQCRELTVYRFNEIEAICLVGWDSAPRKHKFRPLSIS